MLRLIGVAFAALCLIGTGSLTMADDATKGEMGNMKDGMKAEKGAMKGDMKAKREEMKEKIKDRKGAIEQGCHAGVGAIHESDSSSSSCCRAISYCSRVSDCLSLWRIFLLRAVLCLEPLGSKRAWKKFFGSSIRRHNVTPRTGIASS